jgi:hypothetical protein
VQTRRLVAVGVVVVIVIAMAVLISSCESSQTKNALKTYNANVNGLITSSNNNGTNLFAALTSGELSSSVGELQTKLEDIAHTAQSEVSLAEGFSVPSQMSGAQTSLLQVMRLRATATATIAANIQGASSKSTSKDAVYNISVAMSELYSSDVTYKTFVTTDIAQALHGAGIAVGHGVDPQQINPDQIVPDLGWLQSTFIAEKIGASLSTAQANVNNAAPGLHGHSLNFVTVDGTQLDPTGVNTVPVGSSGPTFTLNITNGGNFNEYDVVCEVSIKGLSDTGTTTIPETFSHQTSTCSVTLPSRPPSSTFSVTARVLKVPGETNLANNVITYTITFN